MPSYPATIQEALAGYRLLEHPFYRRWTQGTLRRDEVREYAAQYRFIERSQPGWLVGIRDRLPDGAARNAVVRVLADETDATASHVDLFDGFAAAIGAPEESIPTPATARLIETVDGLVADGPAPGLAALLAYELQSPEVSREKAVGLRAHYGVDGEGTEFWDTHARLDVQHGGWLLDALDEVGGTVSVARSAARSAATRRVGA
jgi:pyrroloquinoline quinone (PQQ) biosynthesis protein C